MSLIRNWKRRGFLDCNYTIFWEKRRDLINEAVALTTYGTVPQELKANMYIAHEIEATGSKTLGNQFNLELKFFYYLDSNGYHSAGGKLGLNCLF